MKYFQIYKAPNTNSLEEEIDNINIVKEGISWPAFFFNVFYLLYHKMFLYFAIYLIFSWVLFAMLDYYHVNEAIISVISFSNSLIFALEANNIRSYFLEKKGFQLVSIVTASSKNQSEEKYFLQDYFPKSNKTNSSKNQKNDNTVDESFVNKSIIPQV